MSDTVILALISSLGTVIAGFLMRWLVFRMTLSGKLAVGADEEFKAFRHELQEKIKLLENKIDLLTEQNNALKLDRMTRDIRIAELETAQLMAKHRITELEAKIAARDARISLLEEEIHGLKSRSGEIKEG